MTRVLLLIPAASYRATDFMEAAGRLDVEVVVGCDRHNPLDDLHPERQVALDFYDLERGAAQIEAYGERYPIDRIVAVDDAGTRLAARASRRLELPHSPVAAVEATRNKALLRQRLAAAGIDSPAYRVMPLAADATAIASELAYPVVLKPLSLSASRGVIRADSPDEFVAAVARIAAILQRPECAAEAGPERDRLLIEGYIAGLEVSVEGILTQGRLQLLALFDKPDPLEGPFFEETIYVTPSRLSESEQRALLTTTQRACAALGLSDGPVHAELRLNQAGVYPIDIAARSIGGLCSRTLSFGMGMSLEELILRHAVGMDDQAPVLRPGASGVMMIPVPQAGILRSAGGIREAEAVPLIESVTISLRPGSELVPLPEGSEYLGFIFARGETPEQVEAALRQAHACLRFEIE
jgi:biotin carboxylase